MFSLTAYSTLFTFQYLPAPFRFKWNYLHHGRACDSGCIWYLCQCYDHIRHCQDT